MKIAHHQVLHHHFKPMDKVILQITSIQAIASICEIASAISPYLLRYEHPNAKWMIGCFLK
jgi:hypothetical protein